jgi:hypothetical protein
LAVCWLRLFGGLCVSPRGCFFPFFLFGWLFYEFRFASFEFFFACYAAEVVGFAFVGDFVFGGVFVEDGAADWVSVHCVWS